MPKGMKVGVFNMRICKNCEGLIPKIRRIGALYCSDMCGNRLRGRRYYSQNPGAVRARREKASMNVAQRMYYRVKCRAKRANILFSLTFLI